MKQTKVATFVVGKGLTDTDEPSRRHLVYVIRISFNFNPSFLDHKGLYILCYDQFSISNDWTHSHEDCMFIFIYYEYQTLQAFEWELSSFDYNEVTIVFMLFFLIKKMYRYESRNTI